MTDSAQVAVIGAGPAGLMAAEALAAEGLSVCVYDAMPSFGRKFLMAGKSGLNITHAEQPARFLGRYPDAEPRLHASIEAFGNTEIVNWMEGLGISAFTGSTGRIFPQQMKASPLLRAWLQRLSGQGVTFKTKHRWTGWSAEGALDFETPEGLEQIKPDATILALGGASWARLGSDGAWVRLLQQNGVSIAPFLPANCGFLIDWSDRIKSEFAGAPVKGVKLFVPPDGPDSRGEFVITARGVESGGVYTLSRHLRDQIHHTGEATLFVDLLPDLSHDQILKRVSKPRGKQSWSNHLRKTLNLSAVKRALLYEVIDRSVFDEPVQLTNMLKALPLALNGIAPLDEAISVAGGVTWDALDDDFMLTALPGVFCAGEMLDWEAPTGGYLITACLATGRAAGQGAIHWLRQKRA